MPYSTGDNKFGVCKWIVDPIAGLGTHTTITAAIASASSGDTIFIKNGTYTENFSLKSGVDLVAFSDQGDTPQVTVLGTITFTAAGQATLAGFRIETNGSFSLVVSGSNACVLNVTDCDLNCTNNTGISFTNSNAASAIYIYECYGDLTTTGIALFAHSSAGLLEIDYSRFTNTGGSSTASTASAGVLNYYYNYFFSPITNSGSNTLNATHNRFDTAAQNVTALTIGGGGGSAFDNYRSGSASAISVGGTLLLSHASVDSTNTNAITGAGSLFYGMIDFENTGIGINTTTRTVSIASAFQRINTQVISATGNYTPTAGTKWVEAIAQGGGGAGGGAASTGVGEFSTASGGSAGENAVGIFSAAQIGASVSCTIGAAGTANSGAAGGNGGTTSFGALLTAAGGTGGTSSAASAVSGNQAGVAGGTGGSGGSYRSPGFSSSPGFFSTASSLLIAGNGANSQLGSGGLGAIAGVGGAASGHGSGGGGSSSSASTAARLGGVGAIGFIIVKEYI